MGVVDNIDFYSFPRQKTEGFCKVGDRVSVCYKYDTSRCHEGVIVRGDMEAPGETIIKLDNGRYLRATECQYSIRKEEAATAPKTNADRIRNMTDVEIARFIGHAQADRVRTTIYGKKAELPFGESEWLEWLRSPVEV